MNPTRNDIPVKSREAVVEVLNARLADMLDLKLRAKQAHWNVKGENFLAMHTLFDAIAEMADEAADGIAERAVALGGMANGLSADVVTQSILDDYPRDITAWQDHAQAIGGNLAELGQAIRSDISRVTELNDQGTMDLLTGVVRLLDKMLWQTDAHLQVVEDSVDPNFDPDAEGDANAEDNS